MNWIRKTYLWASLGFLVLTPSAWAQQATWPPAPIPLQAASSPLGITLGRPTPIYRAGDHTIQQSSYVARGVSRSFDDEPKTLMLPRELPPATPVQIIQDKAKPAAPAPKPAAPVPMSVAPAPKSAAPATKTSKVIEERVIVLDDCCCGMGGPAGQWLSWLRMENNQQWYGSAEFLLWTTRGANLPPLVTTASAFDPEATRGALGFGTTQPLLGPGNTLDGLRPGARFTVGYNFDPCGLRALEASFFFLTRKNEGHLFDSDTTPVIGRPFFNLNTGTQDRELTTSPGILPGDLFAGRGTLAVNQSTTLLGAELNKRWLICDDCVRRVTGLIGFRYLDLADTLRMEENITIARDIPGVGGGAPIARAGDRVFVFDHFDTQNRFYGGQVGVASEWRRGRYVLEGSAKVGLGATVQSVDIDGGQRINTVAGGVQSFQGGLYALPSNIGHHRQTRFAVVPEVGLKLGYQMTDNVRFFVGYDFLYWSSVVRPGDQIDQAIDVNQVPNAGGPFPTVNQRRPAVLFQTSSYWAHGMNAGFEIRY